MSTRDDAAGDGATSVLTPFRKSGHLAVPEVREMPKPPARWLPLIGPGIIAAGVGLSSGEFVLFPFIASQVGLVFVWAAVVGVVSQYFVTMEVERYALATGETAVTGFSRFWPHWGLVFAILTYCANLWPGWATSGSSDRCSRSTTCRRSTRSRAPCCSPATPPTEPQRPSAAITSATTAAEVTLRLPSS